MTLHSFCASEQRDQSIKPGVSRLRIVAKESPRALSKREWFAFPEPHRTARCRHLPTIVALFLCCLAHPAASEPHPSISSYGTVGLIDMPTAQAQPDGQLSFSASLYGGVLRNTLNFQITPRLSGTFRYSILRNYFPDDDLFDRSFDLQYNLADEGTYFPSVAIGLRDFGGTGIFESEYLVATKQATNNVRVTVGLGWGRLGSYGSFRNPLGAISQDFNDRPSFGGINDTGKIAFGRLFHGPTALFAGADWTVTDQLTLKIEYSSDAYDQETSRMGFQRKTPFNFGIDYRFKNGVGASAYLLHGSELGIVLSYSLNPASPRFESGVEGAPPSVGDPSETWSWTGAETEDSTRLRANVRAAMNAYGLDVESLDISGDTATIRLDNSTYLAVPEAIGRASRSLTQTLPPQVEVFRIVLVTGGMAVSQIELRRSDIEDLEGAPDGSWQSYSRAVITDPVRLPATYPTAYLDNSYPKFEWRLGPYLTTSLFDPDNPVRADLGIQGDVSWSPAPGFVLSGSVRKKIVGNRDQSTRVSDSVLPHVRSDTVLYDKEGDPALSYLTADYFFRPGKNLFGRVTAGYLETMYGGVSTELLWKPVTGPIAFGAELNYAVQRGYDTLFDFKDYSVVTGHASVYYDFGNGYLGEVDAGRYLAGDYGATVSLDREFGNGFKLGAFFTLTNVSSERFGEGSFDKGIRISIPLTWLSGEPSTRGFASTIRPVSRDGGARLDVRNRLYGLVSDFQDPTLNQRWGAFWR